MPLPFPDHDEFGPIPLTNIGISSKRIAPCYLTTEIKLEGHTIQLTGIFKSLNDEGAAAWDMQQQLPKKLLAALKNTNILDRKSVDKVLTDIFMELQKAHPQAVIEAICTLRINDRIYIVNLGEGHAMLIDLHGSKSAALRGCYQVSQDPTGKKRTQYWEGATNAMVSDVMDIGDEEDQRGEITDQWAKGIPKIDHLELNESNGFEVEGYQKGDYLILGDSSIWRYYSLKSCFCDVEAGDRLRQDPSQIALIIQRSLVLTKTAGTVLVFKLS